jgi:hypothetical protein
MFHNLIRGRLPLPVLIVLSLVMLLPEGIQAGQTVETTYSTITTRSSAAASQGAAGAAWQSTRVRHRHRGHHQHKHRSTTVTKSYGSRG